MTCIVGLVHQNGVIIAGDSAGVGGWDLTLRADEKVFKNGPFIMGFTSSFRMGQLLRYRLAVPVQTEEQTVDEFMSTSFIDAVRECLLKGGFAKKENETEQGGTFLVGYRGQLFTVHGDYQVSKSLDGFAACGCGDQIANGAMFASNDLELTPTARVLLALRAAEHFSAGVRAPFNSVELS